MTKSYRYIGKPTQRKDARDIVTGSTTFLSDTKVPGMLYGRVLRSPHAHAVVKRVDKSKALELPGVEAVLSHEDVPAWSGGTPRTVKVLDPTVRFVGDGVALVAATSEAVAEEALRRIEVEYEVLPAAFSLEEALRPGAPQLHPHAPGNVLKPGVPFFGPKSLSGVHLGDVEQGFREADVVVEGTCGFRNLPNPLPPEAPGAIVSWDGPDQVTVRQSTQGAYQDKVMLYLAFNREVEVRVIGGPCGGSYGSKFMTIQLVLQAAALSKASGRPVKLCLTKEEHLAAFTLRLESQIQAKIGLRKSGEVTAVSGEWLIGTGAHSMTSQAQVAVGCGEVQLVLRSPNWDLNSKVVCSNRNPSGIVRGFGGQELKCALLPVLSMGMEKLDIDPLEFFKKNYIKPGDGYFWRDGEWYDYRGIDYTRAMDEGARVFGWQEKWKGWLKPSAVNGSKRIGVGVGLHGNVDVGESISETYVRLDPLGTARIYSPATEHGTGQPSNLCKMVAEVLQLPLQAVSLTPSDTAITPYDFGPVGSRGTYAMGSAAIEAAEDARQKLLEMAAPGFGVDAEDLDTEDGMIFVKSSPDKKVPWGRAITFDRTILGQGRFSGDFTLANCMMTFVEAEVDVETGRVELLRVVNATDAGQIIDPPGLQNQLNGCLGSAGVDSALFEETVIDPQHGEILTANMVDYKWRTFAELPEMQNVVLETPIPTHRFRAIGVGEVATAPGPTAVLLAVSNAIGVRLYDYPVTPERILAALAEARRTGEEGDR